MSRPTDKRAVLKKMEAVRAVIDKEIAGMGDGLYARGLSTEGYAGGYRDALDDIRAALTHGCVADRRGWWRRP